MTDKTAEATQPEFQIHKLYVKDVSCTMPTALKDMSGDWQPELNVELNTTNSTLPEDNTHEVVLTVKCTVTNDKKSAFEAEVAQAGIFTILNVADDALAHTLNAYCPSILYPYLREVIADLVTKAGFPQLNLAPINFDLMYQEQQQKAAEA